MNAVFTPQKGRTPLVQGGTSAPALKKLFVFALAIILVVHLFLLNGGTHSTSKWLPKRDVPLDHNEDDTQVSFMDGEKEEVIAISEVIEPQKLIPKQEVEEPITGAADTPNSHLTPHDAKEGFLPEAVVSREEEPASGTDAALLAMSEEEDSSEFVERNDEDESGPDPRTDEVTTPVTSTTRKSKECLKYILYDKPVKTGSTAISFAIRKYLKKFEEVDLQCDKRCVSEKARQICDGIIKPEHLLSHLTITDDVFYCLKRMGYYSVTSIREPADRWRSSYYYNLREKARHFGIQHNTSYETFMAKYPACALLHYYDNEGGRCNGEDDTDEVVGNRIQRIVARFDEVIDLDEEPAGPMHEAIAGFIEQTNIAGKAVAKVQEIPDMSRLRVEQRLYAALKEKRKNGVSGRIPCHMT